MSVVYVRKAGGALAAVNGTVSAAVGAFPGMRSTRAVWLRLRGVATLPATASCAGEALRRTAPGVAPGFWLDDDGRAARRTAADAIAARLVGRAPQVTSAAPPADLVIACAARGVQEAYGVSVVF